MSKVLRNGFLLALVLAFVACGSEKKRRRHRGDRNEGGEAGATDAAGGSGGRAGGAGSAGKGATSGGSAGKGSGDAGDDAGGSPNGAGGVAAGSAGRAGAGGGGGSEPTSACEGVECSGRGTCVATGGVARCDCDPGYGAVGLECVECSQVLGTLDLDLSLVTISGTLAVNGAPALGSDAQVHFTTPEGDFVFGGEVGEGGYTVDLLPGRYDVVYTATATTEGAPGTSLATLHRGVLLDATGTLDVDVPSVTVSGRLTVNGVNPETAGDGVVYFAREGANTPAGRLSAPDYVVELVPGEYDIVYGVSLEDPGLPSNQHVVLRRGVDVDEDTTLDIDIPSVTLEGSFRVNGEPVETSTEAYVTLQNGDGDNVRLGRIGDGSFSVALVPGTFDVVYTGGTDPGVIPKNAFATVARDVSITESRTLNVDIPMVTVTGDLTVNGEPYALALPDARVGLMNDAGDYLVLAHTDLLAYSASLVPGTYAMTYEGLGLGDNGLPDNQLGILARDLEIAEDGTLDLDIPLATVTGEVTVNGETPSGGAATFFFRRSGGGDTVIAATLSEPRYTAEFLPGTYDAFYGFQVAGPGLPANHGARVLTSVEIDADRSLDLEVPTGTQLSGTVTVNGAGAPSGSDAQISMHRGANERVDLVNLSAVSFDTPVVPGTYTLRYQTRIRMPGVPANTNAPLGCVVVE